MRVTSFKDVAAYIYSKLVFPFKGLAAEEIEVESPIRGKDGEYWHLSLYQPNLSSSYRRNYQRSRARQNRNWFIGLTFGNMYQPIILGEVNNRAHSVRLFETPFRELGVMPLLGKMYDVFDRDSQFAKVMVETSSRGLAGVSHDTFTQYDVLKTQTYEQNRPFRGTASPVVNMERVHGFAYMDDSIELEDAYDEDGIDWSS